MPSGNPNSPDPDDLARIEDRRQRDALAREQAARGAAEALGFASKELTDATRDIAANMKAATDEAAKIKEKQAEALKSAYELLGREVAGKTGTVGKSILAMFDWSQGEGRGMAGSAAGAARSFAAARGAGMGGQMAAGVAGGAVGMGAGLLLTLGAKLFEPVQKVLGTIVEKLTPMSLLAAAMSSASSGVGVFEKSITVLGTVLGSVLLPVFVVATAAVVAFADAISGDLLSAMEEMLKYVPIALTGLSMLGDAAKDAAKFVKAWTSVMIGAMRSAGMNVPAFDPDLKPVRPGANVDGETGKPGRIPTANELPTVPQPKGAGGGVQAGGGVGGKGPTPQTGAGQGANLSRGLFGELVVGLQETIKELRMSSGPRAQIMDVAGVNRAATMAALNLSPFERKNLEMLERLFRKLEEAVAKLNPATTF